MDETMIPSELEEEKKPEELSEELEGGEELSEEPEIDEPTSANADDSQESEEDAAAKIEELRARRLLLEGEIVHAAMRGEKFTTIFVNNAIYGMTGGQMAPTSLPGQVTQTSPYGRDVNHCGWPIKVCEMLSTLEGPEYIARVAANNVKNVKNAKKAIKKAFENQIAGKGFSLVEVVSACPTNWGMTPQKALEWVDTDMLPYYPLGVYKDRSAAKEETK